MHFSCVVILLLNSWESWCITKMLVQNIRTKFWVSHVNRIISPNIPWKFFLRTNKKEEKMDESSEKCSEGCLFFLFFLLFLQHGEISTFVIIIVELQPWTKPHGLGKKRDEIVQTLLRMILSKPPGFTGSLSSFLVLWFYTVKISD